MTKTGWQRFRKLQHHLDRKHHREAGGLHPSICRIEQCDRGNLELEEALKEKAESPSSVYLTRLPNGEKAALKHYRPTRRFDLRNALGFSKALYSLRAAESIQRQGFRAAKPLAAWSEPGNGSFLLLEDLSTLPRLKDALTKGTRHEQRDLLVGLALLVR